MQKAIKWMSFGILLGLLLFSTAGIYMLGPEYGYTTFMDLPRILPCNMPDYCNSVMYQEETACLSGQCFTETLWSNVMYLGLLGAVVGGIVGFIAGKLTKDKRRRRR